MKKIVCLILVLQGIASGVAVRQEAYRMLSQHHIGKRQGDTSIDLMTSDVLKTLLLTKYTVVRRNSNVRCNCLHTNFYFPNGETVIPFTNIFSPDDYYFSVRGPVLIC